MGVSIWISNGWNFDRFIGYSHAMHEATIEISGFKVFDVSLPLVQQTGHHKSDPFRLVW